MHKHKRIIADKILTFEQARREYVKNISIRLNSIKRCINNLLSNSLKFSKNIEITCNKKNNYVEIIIDDDGPGIPQKERKKV